VGIQFDVWHLWNTHDLEGDIAREIGRFVGVHVCDWREPTRGWADRVLPGDGIAPVTQVLAAETTAVANGIRRMTPLQVVTGTTFSPRFPTTPGAFDPSSEIYNRLLRERIVFLGTDVNDHIANQIAARFEVLANLGFGRCALRIAAPERTDYRGPDSLQSPDYLRAVSTGPLCPMVLAVTTARDALNVGVTFRTAAFSR
jgi:hypothetical protein